MAAFRLTVAFVVLAASVAQRASAQEGRSAVGISYETSQAEELNAAERKIRRGKAGVISSTLLLGGGITMIAMGSSLDITFGSPNKALTGAGALLTAASVAGLFVGGVALAKGRAAKRNLERSPPVLLLGPTGAELRVHF